MATGGMSGIGFLGGLLKGLAQGNITRKELSLKDKYANVQQGWLDRALAMDEYNKQLLQKQIEAADYDLQAKTAISPDTYGKMNALVSLIRTFNPQGGIAGVGKQWGAEGLNALNNFIANTLGIPIYKNVPNLQSATEQQAQLIDKTTQSKATIEKIKEAEKRKTEAEKHRLKMEELRAKYESRLASGNNKSPYKYIINSTDSLKKYWDKKIETATKTGDLETAAIYDQYRAHTEELRTIANDIVNNPQIPSEVKTQYINQINKLLPVVASGSVPPEELNTYINKLKEEIYGIKTPQAEKPFSFDDLIPDSLKK